MPQPSCTAGTVSVRYRGDTILFAGRHDTQLVKIAPSGGRLVFADKPGTHVFQSEVS